MPKIGGVKVKKIPNPYKSEMAKKIRKFPSGKKK